MWDVQRVLRITYACRKTNLSETDFAKSCEICKIEDDKVRMPHNIEALEEGLD